MSKETSQSLQLIKQRSSKIVILKYLPPFLELCDFVYRYNISASFISTNPLKRILPSNKSVLQNTWILHDCTIKRMNVTLMKERFYDPTFNTRSPETDENYPFPPPPPLLLPSSSYPSSSCPSSTSSSFSFLSAPP